MHSLVHALQAREHDRRLIPLAVGHKALQQPPKRHRVHVDERGVVHADAHAGVADQAWHRAEDCDRRSRRGRSGGS
eukprot:362233-Chlamydomonas_euryale.AAC.2